MVRRSQSGFTLIEVMLVLAISGALMLIAFMGTGQFRARSSFNAAVNQLVASVGDARTQATAAINTVGPGTGAVNCGGGPDTDYVFAGVAWSVTDTASGAVVQLDYYASARTVPAACIFQTKIVKLPSPLRVDNPPAGQVRRVLFVRDAAGGLAVCHSSGPASANLLNFQAGGCVPPAGTGPITIGLEDQDGFKAQVKLESNGLATRLN